MGTIANKTFDNKVLEDVQGIINGSLNKNLILCTKNQVYHTVDGYKTKKLEEALEHNGIKYDDRIDVTGDPNRGCSGFSKFYFEPDNKYFYKVDFDICCRPSGVWFAPMLRSCISQILKIYPSKNFQVISGLPHFITFIDDDSTTYLHNRKEISLYTDIWNDLQTKKILPWGCMYKLHEDTVEKLKTFFDKNGYDTDAEVFPTSSCALIAYLKKAGLSPENKALRTRNELTQKVFSPMFEAAKEKLKAILTVTSSDAKEWLANHPVESTTTNLSIAKEFIRRPFIMRNGEWLMCTEDVSDKYYGKAMFYNTTKKTKFMVTISNGRVQRICVFDTEKINLLNQNETKLIETYMWGSHLTFLYDDFEYVDTMKMYDINGNEITYKECFKDTIIPELLEISKEKIYAPALKRYIKGKPAVINTSVERKLMPIDFSNHKIEKLLETNRIPKDFFLMLCLKKEYQTATEQLVKCGYLNILNLMVNDQNAFKSTGDYWDYTIFFDKTKTNIKDSFNLNMNQLKVLDEWLGMNKDVNIQIVNMSDELFGKEKVKMIDKETFIGLIDFYHTENVRRDDIKTLAESVEALGISNLLKNPKETLTIFRKVRNIPIWRDYLRMRKQLKEYVENGIIQINMKNYKIIPDKSTRFVTLRGRNVTRTYSRYSYYESAETQLDSYRCWYKNLTVLSRTNERINVLLNMDTSEHIRFLHDELSELVTIFRDQQRDILFTNAAKRVEKYEWENDKIIIMAPKNTSEIVNEAHTLSHCVASFIDPIIDGTENVMFIRKKNIPGCSWYTMAIDNHGNIEQIHNFRNGNLSTLSQKNAYETCGLPSYEEQIALVPILKKWAKEKGINVDSIRESYGALGARR